MSTAIDLAGALHEAVLYSAPDELAERLVPRLLPSLHEGAPVVAVLDETTRAELRRALGDAAEQVAFPDPAVVHRVPPFTVAARWARLSRRVSTPTGRATVVGQHVEGLPGCGENHWARLDIALNVAVVGLPITVLCPYRNDDPVLARVEATHPRLVTATGMVSSGSYRPPVEALVEYPPPPPPELGPFAAELSFGAEELGDLRHLVAEVVGRSGAAPDRVADLVLAVNEIGSNSIEHGAGQGRLRLWVTDEAVTAEVADGGTADLPFPGMVAPPAVGARGRGLWLASELCDVLQVWSDTKGTVVRLRMDHERPSSAQAGRGQIGRSPQLPCQVSPGSIVIRPLPEFSASGGQVIGSTATARPRPGWSSGVKTCTQPNAGSAHTSTPPCGPEQPVAHELVAGGGHAAAERVVQHQALERAAVAEVGVPVDRNGRTGGQAARERECRGGGELQRAVVGGGVADPDVGVGTDAERHGGRTDVGDGVGDGEPVGRHGVADLGGQRHRPAGLRRDPRRQGDRVRGPVDDVVEGVAQQAVDGVAGGRLVQRELLGCALPGPPTTRSAVRPGHEHGAGAARGAAVEREGLDVGQAVRGERAQARADLRHDRADLARGDLVLLAGEGKGSHVAHANARRRP